LKSGKVIGVVKDFNFKSLHKEVESLIMHIYPEYFTATIKIKSGNEKETIAYIKGIWEKTAPDFPFSYQFLDEELNNMYKSEQTVSKIFLIFSCLTILIACLGLFGLASFTAHQRTKEVGIRKVLGASVMKIALLLTRDFIKLVLIGLVIASPIAWLLMNNWLQNFAYHIKITVWVFLLAAIAGILIAIVTVGYQAVRAALINPVKSLRSE
jgi:putative ABC transport system permease protein